MIGIALRLERKICRFKSCHFDCTRIPKLIDQRILGRGNLGGLVLPGLSFVEKGIARKVVVCQ